jgi:7,8-dihydro-6-hydroxymethylpterin-pyrophosphokinase
MKSEIEEKSRENEVKARERQRDVDVLEYSRDVAVEWRTLVRPEESGSGRRSV